MSSGYEGRRNESYGAAWELAWDNLPIDALPEVAKATGSEFDGRTFHVRLLDRSASVDVETKEVCGDLPELDRFLSIVILHYLAGDHRARARLAEAKTASPKPVSIPPELRQAFADAGRRLPEIWPGLSVAARKAPRDKSPAW